MNHSYGHTLIKDLPEIKDNESYLNYNHNLSDINNIQGEVASNNYQKDYEKYIRKHTNTNNMPAESGMYTTNSHLNIDQMHLNNQNFQQNYNNMPQHYEQNYNNTQQYYEQNYKENYNIPSISNENYNNVSTNDKNKYNCAELADHVSDCRICKKFYSTDNTPYLIVIIILSIICILLLKRVLNL